MRKTYIGLSLCLLLSLNVSARSEKNIDDMIAAYEEWPSYKKSSSAKPSEHERALAKDAVDRIISLAAEMVGWELDALNKSRDEVEASSDVSEGWKEAYSLQSSLRHALDACKTSECVEDRVNAQKRFFNWIERVGIEEECSILDEIGCFVRDLFHFEKEPAFHALDPSFVRALFDEAEQRIPKVYDQQVRNFENKFKNIPKAKFERALRLVLDQMALSATDAKHKPFIRPSLNNKHRKFTYDWRYSENAWLENIRQLKLDLIAENSEAPLEIPMRLDLAGSHKLECHAPVSGGGMCGLSHAGLCLGGSAVDCYSEQGGRYTVVTLSLGIDVSIAMELGTVIYLRSIFPGLRHYSPAGYVAGAEAGLDLLFGGRFSVGLRYDGIRVYTLRGELGKGVEVSLAGQMIKQVSGAHSI
jgi:hypothetical protein